MKLKVIEPFYITGRGIVVTVDWPIPPEVVATGDYLYLPSGLKVKVAGVEMAGQPKAGKQIGLILSGVASKTDVPPGTILSSEPPTSNKTLTQDLLRKITNNPDLFIMAITDDGKVIIQDNDVSRAWDEEQISITLIHLPKAEAY